MKRFIDLRFQGTGSRFAFWDTVTDSFDTYDGESAWATWAEFEEQYRREADYAGGSGWDSNYVEGQITRHRGLCPSWVFDPPTDKELDFPNEPDDYLDIVFDGPPAHESGRFIEVEDAQGRGIGIGDIGDWVHRPDGYWAIRLRYDRFVDYIGRRPSQERGQELSAGEPQTGHYMENLVFDDVENAPSLDIVAASEYVARHPEMFGDMSRDAGPLIDGHGSATTTMSDVQRRTDIQVEIADRLDAMDLCVATTGDTSDDGSLDIVMTWEQAAQALLILRACRAVGRAIGHSSDRSDALTGGQSDAPTNDLSDTPTDVPDGIHDPD